MKKVGVCPLVKKIDRFLQDMKEKLLQDILLKLKAQGYSKYENYNMFVLEKISATNLELRR